MKKQILKKKNQFLPAKIEPFWQKIWQEKGIYQPDLKTSKHPYYNLMMFPYPSAEGLHVGNVYAFTGSDIWGRFMRLKGFDVFEPIGLDGFGIHSENYALKVGCHPEEQAKISQKNFYRQLHSIGNGFAWKNTLETYDPEYYQWTQWIFIQLFKVGLAYRKKAAVNFCPSCKTVLADEQVINGACERCQTQVGQKNLEQWFFKITKYADRLLENLKKIDWSEKVKIAQVNWIGKKQGIDINYEIIDENGKPVKLNNKQLQVTCFTTRPDTNFGATFVVLAPESPIVEKLLKTPRIVAPQNTGTSPRWRDRRRKIQKYVEQAKKKTSIERIAEGREKTGVFTGFYCLNQLTGKKMPIWISDFVLMDVGTGAVVGVPGHDIRDFEFAKRYGLEIIRVVVGKDGDQSSITRPEQVQEKEGIMINSGFLNGMDIHQATKKVMDYIEKKGWGKKTISYHLRDWLISRQRYWGPPIPMIYCQKCADKSIIYRDLKSGQNTSEVGRDFDPSRMVKTMSACSSGRRGSRQESKKNMAGWFPVPEHKLPVLLPKVKDWRPKGEGKGPLDKIPEFYQTKCPHCGGQAKRETDVSDTFLDSAWYFLRYPSVSGNGEDIPKVLRTFHLRGGLGRTPRDKRHKHSGSGKDTPGVTGTGSPGVEGKESLPWNPQITQKWLPVDMYIGGAEHSVLHLLYSRFLWMVFYDLGYFNFSSKGRPASGWDEPFTKFRAHGLLISEGAKMSKSKGNVVIPDEYIKKFGADTLRCYLMFLGPLADGGDFRDTGMRGMYKFLNRVWDLVIGKRTKNTPGVTQRGSPGVEELRMMHKTIKRVEDGIKRLKYNTSIAAIMEYINFLKKQKEVSQESLRTLLLLLAPFAPYLTEELWQRLKRHDSLTKVDKGRVTSDGGPKRQRRNSSEVKKPEKDYHSIHLHPWPKYDPKLAKEEKITLVVQVNGKLRATIILSLKDAQRQKKVVEEASSHPQIATYLKGSPPKKTFFVSGKLINFVTN